MRCTACGDPKCEIVWRECIHGCISIIPQFIGGYVKVMSARGQESIDVFSKDEAIHVANERSLTLGGWLQDVKKAMEADRG